MRAAGLVVVAAAVLAAPSLGSCGGLAAVTDGSDGASHGDGDGTVRRDAATGDDAAADDAIADVGSDVVYTDDCPASPPADGASCSEPGRMCEYGGSWWLACDRALVCNGGAWSTRY